MRRRTSFNGEAPRRTIDQKRRSTIEEICAGNGWTQFVMILVSLRRTTSYMRTISHRVTPRELYTNFSDPRSRSKCFPPPSHEIEKVGNSDTQLRLHLTFALARHHGTLLSLDMARTTTVNITCLSHDRPPHRSAICCIDIMPLALKILPDTEDLLSRRHNFSPSRHFFLSSDLHRNSSTFFLRPPPFFLRPFPPKVSNGVFVFFPLSPTTTPPKAPVNESSPKCC